MTIVIASVGRIDSTKTISLEQLRATAARYATAPPVYGYVRVPALESPQAVLDVPPEALLKALEDAERVEREPAFIVTGLKVEGGTMWADLTLLHTEAGDLMRTWPRKAFTAYCAGRIGHGAVYDFGVKRIACRAVAQDKPVPGETTIELQPISALPAPKPPTSLVESLQVIRQFAPVQTPPEVVAIPPPAQHYEPTVEDFDALPDETPES